MAKNIFLSLLVLLFASSVLYLVPSFSYVYQEKRYSFENFPSPFDQYKKDLEIKIPRLSETYIYKMESSTKVEKPEDWNNLVSKDQRILEQRLDTVLANNYEIEIKKIDNKAVYAIYSNTRLASTNILTNTNSIFAIKSPKNQTNQTELPTDNEETDKTLDLKREDFGFAEIIPTTSKDGSTQSGIRMSLGLFLTPEKIKLISDKIGTQLKIEVGDTEYQGFIDYNQAGTPTNLIISGITTKEEASYVKAFLNTSQYNLAYNLGGIEKAVVNQNKIIIFIGLILGTLIIAIVLNKLTINNFNTKKGLLIFILITIFAASLKLFAIPLTLPSIIILIIIFLFTVYKLKTFYYLGLLVTLGTIKAFGILNGFDLSGSAAVLLILFSIFIWLTNYVEFKQK